MAGTNIPVWYLQAGVEDAAGKFHARGQASAVLVAVRKKGGNGAQKVLLTAQHILRTGTGGREGSYHTAFRAWPPDVGYNDATAIRVTILRDLTPESVTPLEEPEDLGFLELPSGASGAPTAVLLEDAAYQVDLNELNIAGYISGDNLISDHAGLVKPAMHLNWRIVGMVHASAVGILGPGYGSPGPGLSGGGVFRNGALAGIYRGKFTGTGEHLFLPITRLREWCQLHDYELLSAVHAARWHDLLLSESPTIPFVNREKLRGRLDDFAKPSDWRALSVDGPKGSGKSYSWELLQRAAKSIGAVPLMVNLALPDGRILMLPEALDQTTLRLGLDKIKMREAIKDDQPTPARMALSFVSWLVGEASDLKQRFWLAYDGLNQAPEVSEYLFPYLLQEIEIGSFSQIFFIFLGCEQASSVYVAHEDVTTLSSGVLKRYLKEVARLRKRRLEDDDCERILATVLGSAVEPFDYLMMRAISLRLGRAVKEVILA